MCLIKLKLDSDGKPVKSNRKTAYKVVRISEGHLLPPMVSRVAYTHGKNFSSRKSKELSGYERKYNQARCGFHVFLSKVAAEKCMGLFDLFQYKSSYRDNKYKVIPVRVDSDDHVVDGKFEDTYRLVSLNSAVYTKFSIDPKHFK